MRKKVLTVCFLAVCVFGSMETKAAVTNTSGAGMWSGNGNWDNGVPGSADDANVNHDMTIDQNISTTKGDFIINSPIQDVAGGTAYTLDMAGTGSNKGIFDVNADVNLKEE